MAPQTCSTGGSVASQPIPLLCARGSRCGEVRGSGGGSGSDGTPACAGMRGWSRSLRAAPRVDKPGAQEESKRWHLHPGLAGTRMSHVPTGGGNGTGRAIVPCIPCLQHWGHSPGVSGLQLRRCAGAGDRAHRSLLVLILLLPRHRQRRPWERIRDVGESPEQEEPRSPAHQPVPTSPSHGGDTRSAHCPGPAQRMLHGPWVQRPPCQGCPCTAHTHHKAEPMVKPRRSFPITPRYKPEPEGGPGSGLPHGPGPCAVGGALRQ